MYQNVIFMIAIISTTALYSMDTNNANNEELKQQALLQIQQARSRVQIPPNLSDDQIEAACNDAAESIIFWGKLPSSTGKYEEYLTTALTFRSKQIVLTLSDAKSSEK